MVRRICSIGLLVLALLALAAISRGMAVPPKPEGEVKAPPKEETVEAYDSKTMGAVQVKGDTKDYFEITKDGKPAHSGAPPLLNKTLELAPGTYEIKVNKSMRKVTAEAGKKIVLLTGTLAVEGKKANFYVPFEGKERRVAGNPRTLNVPMALFAGTYRVELNVGVNKTVVLTDSAKVLPGMKTVLQE